MKKRLIPILTAALAAGTTITAFADLPRRDSAQFDYKYDMVESPAVQDVDGGGKGDFTGMGTYLTLGTGADAGTLKINASDGSKYLVSNLAVGTAGDGWRSMAASSTTGFTVEARVKVTACTGKNGAICIEAGPSDSKVYARLNLFGNKIGWNGTDLKEMNTSEWHTYRITREGGKAVHSVYVDGELVAENLGTGFTYNTSILYRMLLGSPGGDWKGKAEVAWLRFHKGAYAPVDEKAFIKQNRLQSDKFDVKYEMDASDSRLSPTAGTASDWKTTVDNRGGGVSMADGILSVTTGGYPAYWDTTDTAWKNLVGANTPYTVEFKIKVGSADTNDRAINLTTGSAGVVGNLFVGANSVQWSPDMTKNKETFVTLDTSDNTDKFHTFRIAYDGATRHGFTVWRDGEVIGEYLVDCTNFYNFSGNALGIVRFGKAGGFNDGSFNVNYVRWKIGGVYPPDNRKGMKVILR